MNIDTKPFDPETLHGVSFFDGVSNRKMRYLYPDAGHWSAGWIVVQNRSGEWMTLRKATSEDILSISGAIVHAHHCSKE